MALSPKYLDPKQVYQLAPAFWDWVLLTLIFSYIFKKAFAKFAHGTAGHGMFGSPMGHGHGRMLSVDNALAFILGLTVSTLLVSVRGFTFKGFVDAGNLGLLLGIMFGFMAYSAAMNREMAKHGIMPGMMGGFGMGGHGIAVPRAMPLTVGAITGLFTYTLLTIGTNISEWIGSLFWLIAIGIIFSVIGAKQSGSVAGAFGGITGDVGRLHDNIVQTQATATKASKTVDDLVKDYSANFNTLGEGLAAARGIIANKGWFKFSKEQKGKLKTVFDRCILICDDTYNKVNSVFGDFTKIKTQLSSVKQLEAALKNDLSVLVNKKATPEIKTKIQGLSDQFNTRISEFDRQLSGMINAVGSDLSGLERLSSSLQNSSRNSRPIIAGLKKDIDEDNFAEGVKKLEEFERAFSRVQSELDLSKHSFETLKVMFKGVSDLVGPYDKALADLRKQYEALSGELSVVESRQKFVDELKTKIPIVESKITELVKILNALNEGTVKGPLVKGLADSSGKINEIIGIVSELNNEAKEINGAKKVLTGVGAFFVKQVEIVNELNVRIKSAQFKVSEPLSAYQDQVSRQKLVDALNTLKTGTLWGEEKLKLDALMVQLTSGNQVKAA